MISSVATLRRCIVVPVILLLSTSAFNFGVVFGADDYTQWSNSTTITLNSVGMGLTANVTNFPVLVRLNPGNFTGFANVNAGGTDMRFSKTDGTHLPYQIERWVDNAGNNDTAEIWVLVPQVNMNDGTQSFKMYWGKTGSGDSSRPQVVFDVANGFLGVYHLSNNNFNDATSSGLNGTNNSTADVAGIIGVGKNFNGSAYISMPSTNFGNSFTISMWMKPNSTVSNLIGLAANKGSGAATNGFAYFVNTYNTANGELYFEDGNGTLGAQLVSGTGQVSYASPTSWYYLAVTVNRSGGTGVQYMNGANVTNAAPVRTDFANSGAWRIGEFTDGNFALNGYVDEVVVSTVIRSADWIKLSYQNQQASQTLVSICTTQPSFTANLVSQTIPAGDTVTFSVTATNGSSYQWQDSGLAHTVWTNSLGATNSSTFKFQVNTAENGIKYRCLVSSSCATTSSAVAVLSVCQPPTIITPPSNQSIFVGQTANFSINSLYMNTYQWQMYNGSSWTSVGTNSPNYSLSSVPQSYNGYLFRCILTNSCKVVTSNSVTLTVCTPITITNPSGQSIHAGDTASFSVSATAGSGTFNYQWQDSIPPATVWANIATGATYKFKSSQNDNGNFYRCIGSNTCGNPDTSTRASLTVCTPPSIGNPSGQSVTAGQTATFTVSSGGSGTLTYQWQRSNDTAKTWNNVTSGTGGTTNTYNLVTAGTDNAAQFRCFVHNGCGADAYSTAATLTVCTRPAITANPVSQNDTAGHTATFSVTATGTPSLQFLWQDSATGTSGWATIATATNPIYTFAPASSQDGWKFRCNVSSSSSCGSPGVSSSAATLSVCTPPSIATQPASLPLKQVGDNATFTVVAGAQTSSPGYQWQRSPNGTTWSNAAEAISTAATYAFVVTASDTGAQFRCNISNGCGSISSNIVTLSGCTPPSTTNPANQNVTANTTATFSVTGTGTGTLLYQWQDSAAGGWVNVPSGGTAASYSFTAVANMSGTKYRSVVTGSCGVPAVSAAAVLSVCTPPTTISSQPASQTKMVGDNAVFSVTIPGDVTSPQFQWQDSVAGSTWVNAPGTSATTPACTVAVVPSFDGAQFRCKIFNSCNTIYSNIAMLSICTPPAVTTPPMALNAVNGLPASLSVAATGTGTFSYQWEQSVDNGATWNSVGSTGTAATYTFTAAASQDGWRYHCIVSNGCGSAAVSGQDTLKVCTLPTIVLQPVNQSLINIGDTAVFTVAASGSSLSYQWQRSPDGTIWSGVSTGTGGTGTTYRLAVAATDNNSRFRCAVSNTCGRDSSTGATLTVCLPPQITGQPHDSNIVVGAAASFSVTGSGTTLAYQWQRSNDGLIWADITNEKSSIYSITGKSTDDGAKFHCVVSGKCGSVASSLAKLSVCTPVVMDSQNVTNKSVLVGDTVSFRVVAHGTGLKYSWQKKAAGASAFTAIGNATASYSFVAQSADSGSQFQCVDSGQCGAPVTSLAAQVLVYTPLHAAFKASVTNGQAPMTVQFTDSSTGGFTQRVWDFGDGTKTDTVSQNPSHTYVLANTYTAKLTISGPAPRVASTAQAQIFTWNPGDNPMQIAGTFVLPQKVAYAISNFGTIVPPSPFVNVDTVVLWYKSGSLPQTAAAATYLKGYTLATLKSGGSQYRDTVTMPPLTGSDSVYGLMTSIRWTDGKLSSFAAGNGTMVLMKDTTPVTNQTILSGSYLPNDTARIFLDNVTSIDTSRVDTVGIWYSLAGGTPNFKDTTATKWVTAKQVTAAGAKWSFDIINPQFNNVKTTMYAAVVLVGINGRTSPIKQTSFVVGRDRPANPIRLIARTLSANRIRLSWNNVVSSGIERLYIWYRTGQPVPKSYDFSTIKLDTLIPAVSDTVIIGDKFSEKTKYFFGAQVYKGGLWSYVTDSSSASDSTWAAGVGLDSNSCRVTNLYHDTATNQLRVCWTVDPAQAESLQVGILYSIAGVPITNTGTQQVVVVKAAKDSAYIKLRENLLFDTTYYVSLWLRRANGKWTDPTMYSIDSARTGHMSWQSVTYFSKPVDTVFSLNNQVRLTNTPGDQSQTANTLVYTAVANAAAFVPVGIGIDFKIKDPGEPLNVGLKVDSLPQGYTLKDVRIYHKTAAGLWVIDDNPITLDTVGGYVSVLTNQLVLPFFVMVDTRRPTEIVIDSLFTPVPADSGYSDTIVLSDNIANLKWWFKSTKGGLAYSSGDTSQHGELSDTTYTLVVTVPGGNVGTDNGVRSILIVTDSVHTDTVDLSRRVVRSSSGSAHTEEMIWTPLSVTVTLDTPQVKNALGSFAASDGSWTYDNKKFRLFTWNAGGPTGGEWLEYADSIKDEFELGRGHVVWIKTRARQDIKFGRGITPLLSRKETFSIACAPKSWTDFALPYQFNITIGDILNATQSKNGMTDSLRFCAWKKDSKGNYHTDVVFMKALSDSSLNNEATALTSTDMSGYSVLNPFSDTVFLRIPPVPPALSTVGLSKHLKKSARVGGWALKVVARLSDSTEVSPVYCGYSKGANGGTSFYPASPSFVNSGVGVFDLALKKTAGHAVAHAASNGGYAFVLSFSNGNSQQETMRYHVENTGVLPQGVSAAVFNANTQKFEDLSRGDAIVSLEGNSTAFRWLLVGTKDYLSKASMIARPALLALIGTYPNPFRSFVHIRYDLPYEGVDKLIFSIFDLRGRTIWHNEIACGSKYGTGDMVWNTRSGDGRPVAAGIYILRMTALNNVHKVVGVFQRKMTFVP